MIAPVRTEGGIRVGDPEPLPAPRIDRLRLRHLRLLQLIGATGSLGAAGRALGVSQPAVSLLLRELEAAVGATLVERDTRGARLTAAGRRALDPLAIALQSIRLAVGAARHPAEMPVLRLGCIQAAGTCWLPAALDRLERAGILGGLQLREGRARDLLAALGRGELDLVIGWVDEGVTEGLEVADLDIAPLEHDRMRIVAAAAHPLAGSRGVPVAELARWRWIVPPPGSRTHAAYRRLFLEAGSAPPRVAVECAALHTTLHLVAGSRMLAVALAPVVDHYARLGMVTALDGPRIGLERSLVSVVIRRNTAALPAVRALRAALVAGHAAAAGGEGAAED